jgi:nucleoside-diphosphate-sugar epimerase
MTNNPLAADLDNILARTEMLWEELRGGRILITGATGFFGCWLLESFTWINRKLNLRAEAVGMSRNPAVLSSKAPHLLADPAIKVFAADIRDGKFPEGQFTHIIHAATEASATLNSEHPEVMFDTIVQGTRNVLRHAAKNASCKFLFTSSGAVYGTQPSQISHIQESFHGGPDPLEPASAYAEGKRAAETMCVLAASRQFHPAIARCFAFVGPYMKLIAHFAIGNFIGDRLRGGPIRVQGDGTPFRSYMYASDLMVWLWTILFRGETGRAYNVGSEDAVSIAVTAQRVAEAVTPVLHVEIAREANPKVAPSRYVPCTRRAREELSLEHEVSLPDAIRRTHTWFEERKVYR